jgi:hypothetical protein
MAEKHRKLGGRFNLAAAKEHSLAADAQDTAAEHAYSFEQKSKTHTAKHEPELKAAKAAFDLAAARSKTAFSQSHLLDVEESTGLSEVSLKTLSSYTTKASNTRMHKALSSDKVSNRYAGVKMADEKVRKMDGKSSTAKVAATHTVNEAVSHEIDVHRADKEQILNDIILSALIEEALASKRSTDEKA